MKKLATLCLLPSVFCLWSCTQQKAKPKDERVPVTVAQAVQKDVPMQIRVIGNVQPMSTVAIHAQVAGLLLRVHFREGDDVHRGDLLFEIDPRPLQAALAQAEANLARDEAALKNAQAEVTRYSELVKKDYVTREEYDKIVTSAESGRAVVAADRAAIETARLELGYCRIAAPIDGRTGSLQVHAGNLVRANDTTPLVVINQIRPVYVQFAVPERDFARIRGVSNLPVAATPQAGGTPESGKLTFTDNSVDPQTGTITMKATFTNEHSTLWPGQFVNVAMTVSNRAAAVVVPAQAVQVSQRGQYVYVVTDGNGVEMRPVVVATEIDQQAIIDKGVAAGETVVTDGQIRLTPKSKVEVKKSL